MVQHLAGLRDVFGALDTNGAALPESGNEALWPCWAISANGLACVAQACAAR